MSNAIEHIKNGMANLAQPIPFDANKCFLAAVAELSSKPEPKECKEECPGISCPHWQGCYPALVSDFKQLQSKPEPTEFTKKVREKLNYRFANENLMPSEELLKDACVIIDRQAEEMIVLKSNYEGCAAELEETREKGQKLCCDYAHLNLELLDQKTENKGLREEIKGMERDINVLTSDKEDLEQALGKK